MEVEERFDFFVFVLTEQLYFDIFDDQKGSLANLFYDVFGQGSSNILSFFIEKVNFNVSFVVFHGFDF